METNENIICRLLGHNWGYKDYGNRMQPDGTRYIYQKSRRCSRCDAKEISMSRAEEKWIRLDAEQESEIFGD